MSNTRRATADAPFRQEKFASSPGFERGLMANLVARRCELLADDGQHELIWWVQLMSQAEGGLDALAASLIEKYSARLVTPSMKKFGFKPGQIYNQEKVEAIREEMIDNLDGHTWDELTYQRFPLPGDSIGPLRETPDNTPAQYPAAEFVDWCLGAATDRLATALAEFCLDPCSTGAPWFFPSLQEALRETMRESIERKSAGRVVTEIGRQVYDTLDYALETKCMVLIDGLARTGKTFAVKSWCDLHPGLARYVQVPSSNDDISFFRAIAKSLGVSINLNSKAQQLRDRIEDTLQRGELMLILDEAHYAWPQGNYRDALPSRINWVMTALVNHGVAVALVTTPQFMLSQKNVERKTCWTSEQFTGRIGHYEKLKDSLCDADLFAVARVFLPNGCAKSIKALALYAKCSLKYLAAIESTARRAKFIADKAGRPATFADVNEAIKGSVIPSDEAVKKALEDGKRGGRTRARSVAPLSEPLAALPLDRETIPASAGARINQPFATAHETH